MRALSFALMVVLTLQSPRATAGGEGVCSRVGRAVKVAALETATITFFPLTVPFKATLHVTGAAGSPRERLRAILADIGRLIAYLGASYFLFPALDPAQGGLLPLAETDSDGERLLYLDVVNDRDGQGELFRVYAVWGAEREGIAGAQRAEIEADTFDKLLEVLAGLRAQGRIKRLRFIGHSARGGDEEIGVGLTQDVIWSSSFFQQAPKVNALPTDLFAKTGADIHLLGCHVGKNDQLMKRMHWHFLNQHGHGGRVTAYSIVGPPGQDAPFGKKLSRHLLYQYAVLAHAAVAEVTDSRIVVSSSTDVDAATRP